LKNIAEIILLVNFIVSEQQLLCLHSNYFNFNFFFL